MVEADPPRSWRDYRDRLSTIGRQVEIELPHGRLAGLATGVDEDGRLMVTPPGGAPTAVTVGDVVHLRSAQ
jgi:BirA family biotin operon repressor/biotin-[acetyl-CoA-carboxylase] ligase